MPFDTYAVARVVLVLALVTTSGAACDQSDGNGTDLECGPGTVAENGQCVVADTGPAGSDTEPWDGRYRTG